MGLDAVELVMEVEDRFGIKVPDAEACRMRTVADVAAFVISQLPRSSGICPTARSFYQFRKSLVEHGKLERRSIRPKTRLDLLFPRRSKRRTVWGCIGKQVKHLPRLTATPRIDKVSYVVGSLIVAASIASFAIVYAEHGAIVAILLVPFPCIIVFRLFIGIKDLFDVNFPRGIETVGDVARTIAPIEVSIENSGQRLAAQQKVLDEVRRITAEQLGLPLDKVLPESNFVKDLGVG